MEAWPWQLRVALIFFATVLTVAGLAFQSLNINAGRLKTALFTSTLVGLVYLVVLQMVPRAEGFWERAAYVIGGPVGVLIAMKLFRR